jgi:hypothetical protein
MNFNATHEFSASGMSFNVTEFSNPLRNIILLSWLGINLDNNPLRNIILLSWLGINLDNNGSLTV